MAKTARSKSNAIDPTVEPDPTSDPQRGQPTQEEIALRAYHIYLERGSDEGDPLDDWLQAERELTEGALPE